MLFPCVPIIPCGTGPWKPPKQFFETQISNSTPTLLVWDVLGVELRNLHSKASQWFRCSWPCIPIPLCLHTLRAKRRGICVSFNANLLSIYLVPVTVPSAGHTVWFNRWSFFLGPYILVAEVRQCKNP